MDLCQNLNRSKKYLYKNKSFFLAIANLIKLSHGLGFDLAKEYFAKTYSILVVAMKETMVICLILIRKW